MISRLWAYAERYVLLCLMMMSLPYPRSPLPAYTTLPGALASTGSPALPAMSMPLRFAVSENVPTSLPFTGHAQSSRSLSAPSVTPGRGGSGLDSRGAADGPEAGGSPGAAAAGTGAGAVAASVTSRTARSEYGSLSALGCDFTLSPGRTAATGGAGRASATADGERSGAVVTPLAPVVGAASLGDVKRSVWPTRIRWGLSRLFQTTSSR